MSRHPIRRAWDFANDQCLDRGRPSPLEHVKQRVETFHVKHVSSLHPPHMGFRKRPMSREGPTVPIGGSFHVKQRVETFPMKHVSIHGGTRWNVKCGVFVEF